jgi:hypothetical protein
MSENYVSSPTASRVGSPGYGAASDQRSPRRARPLTRADLLDAKRFTTITEWPVLDEHKHSEKGNIDGALLRLIADNTNARTAHGDHPKLWVGHTSDEPVADGKQPPIIGFVSNLRVASLDPWLERHGLAPHGDGRACLFADYHVHKGKERLLQEYPSRSVERVRSDEDPSYNFLDGVALLRKAPERPLPLMMYGRDWRPPLDAEVVRYDRELPPLAGPIGVDASELRPITTAEVRSIVELALYRRDPEAALRRYARRIADDLRARGVPRFHVSHDGNGYRIEPVRDIRKTRVRPGLGDDLARRVTTPSTSAVVRAAQTSIGRVSTDKSQTSAPKIRSSEHLRGWERNTALREAVLRASEAVRSWLSAAASRGTRSRRGSASQSHDVQTCVTMHRYVKDPAFETLHPRGQPENAGQFIRKSEVPACSTRGPHVRRGKMDAAGSGCAAVQHQGVRTPTVATLPQTVLLNKSPNAVNIGLDVTRDLTADPGSRINVMKCVNSAPAVPPNICRPVPNDQSSTLTPSSPAASATGMKHGGISNQLNKSSGNVRPRVHPTAASRVSSQRSLGFTGNGPTGVGVARGTPARFTVGDGGATIKLATATDSQRTDHGGAPAIERPGAQYRLQDRMTGSTFLIPAVTAPPDLALPVEPPVSINTGGQMGAVYVPTHKAAKRLPTVGGKYEAHIKYRPGFTAAQQKVLRDASYDAALRVHKTYHVISNPALLREFIRQHTKGNSLRPGDPPNATTSEAVRLLQQDRVYWTARLKEAYDALQNRDTTLEFTSEPNANPKGNDTILYTSFYGFRRMGVNMPDIRVTRLFFPANVDKGWQMKHEFGRYFCKLGGEGALASDPIVQWDLIIDKVVDFYDRYVQGNKK